MMVRLSEIEAARAALPPQVVHTPLLFSEDLSATAGGEVFLKLESLQVTGSYKPRAAFTILNHLSPEQKARGAALSSSGNFASAFAYMGGLLGIPTAVVMMERTSPLKVAKSRRYGAEIVLCGSNFEQRWRVLDSLQEERGITAVNTFESRDVVAGHGTLGLEILDDLPEVETVLIPVSSGGLIAGAATAIKERRPGVRVFGVQPEGSNAVTESLRRGEPVRIPEVRTICDALIAQIPGRLPFQHIQRYVDGMVLVTDEEVKGAIRWLVEHAKLVVEAGGAVCAAALLTGKAKAQGKTVVLLSGGNIAPATLVEYLQEGL
jgi:threonine dehydratase